MKTPERKLNILALSIDAYKAVFAFGPQPNAKENVQDILDIATMFDDWLEPKTNSPRLGMAPNASTVPIDDKRPTKEPPKEPRR